jgi:putative endonuclease
MYSEKFSSVYILCSKRNSTLYIGVTKNLPKRIYEHKAKLADSFTKKYNIDKLVYYECFDLIIDAIKREKTLKHYKREAKLELIESFNPSWNDLYQEIIF